jgi:hypothetical protein
MGGEWTRQVAKFTIGPRFAHASCAVDKTIYIFGGQKKGYLDDVWAWDCAGDEWITFTPQGKAPIARVQHTACFSGKEVLVFGGYVENIAEENDLYVLDVLNPEREFTWTQPETKGERPPKRYGHTATMVGERMVVIAGQDSMAQLHDVWVLHCPTYTWTPVACSGDVFLPCALHSATHVAGHGVVVLGGFNRKLRNTGAAFALELDGTGAKGVWKDLQPKDPDRAFGSRSQHRAVAQSSHLIIFGGYDGTRAPGRKRRRMRERADLLARTSRPSLTHPRSSPSPCGRRRQDAQRSCSLRPEQPRFQKGRAAQRPTRAALAAHARARRLDALLHTRLQGRVVCGAGRLLAAGRL